MAIKVNVPQYWTSDQATEVLEFLDNLREAIWTQYQVEIVEQLKSDHNYEYDSNRDIDIDESDVTF